MPYPYSSGLRPQTVPLRLAQQLQLERDEALHELELTKRQLRQARAAAPAQLQALEASEQALRAEVDELLDRNQALSHQLELLHEQLEAEPVSPPTPPPTAAAQSLMHVRDSVARALDASPDASNPWHQGLEAIMAQVDAELRAAGATLFGQAGEAFDPHIHEAIGVTDSPDLLPGVLASVSRPGVRIDDVVLHPAQVIVSK